MKTYFYRGRYTPSAWRNLIAEPKDIGELLRVSIESFGGHVIGCFILRSTEPIGFIEFPDDISANAWCLSLASQDGIDFVEIEPAIKTSDLLTSFQMAATKISELGKGSGW
ncbi:hypothetical protein [Leptolyngbya sp. FACHB-711]|uniref:hypothetical protein n=1 Tax=Leptolyngbya sp. FACHB-711 TaxID=2692813 RepID=UPI001687189E|nr:hypothetical protein [Leptolyngbya sp. FACHB-711]MBD2028130.1 hypothetical protein [Leptolyngbya sp. FACHB-711]